MFITLLIRQAVDCMHFVDISTEKLKNAYEDYKDHRDEKTTAALVQELTNVQKKWNRENSFFGRGRQDMYTDMAFATAADDFDNFITSVKKGEGFNGYEFERIIDLAEDYNTFA